MHPDVELLESRHLRAQFGGDALDLFARYGGVMRYTGSTLCDPLQVVSEHAIGNRKDIVTQSLHDLFRSGS